jgi:ribokinase
MASITVDDTPQNCILVVPGANQALSPADIHAAREVIRSAAVLLCQLEVSVATTSAAMQLARSHGVRTILNPAPATPLPDELLQLADFCVPNETEIELLTGTAIAGPEQAAVAARKLLQRGPDTVIVTMGARGALLARSTEVELVPAVSVTAVDPSGAGDAFIGSMAVFLAEGLRLREALGRASAAAALSVTRLGTQTSFPDRAELEGFLR